MKQNMIVKGYYICYMIQRLLNVYLGRNNPDDRDSYANKRIETPGVLLSVLFKQYFKKMLMKVQDIFKKRNNRYRRYIRK